MFASLSQWAHNDSIEFICAIQKNSYVCMYVCMSIGIKHACQLGNCKFNNWWFKSELYCNWPAKAEEFCTLFITTCPSTADAHFHTPTLMPGTYLLKMFGNRRLIAVFTCSLKTFFIWHISVDGPNVNWKFFEEVQSEIKHEFNVSFPNRFVWSTCCPQCFFQRWFKSCVKQWVHVDLTSSVLEYLSEWE